MNLLQHANRNAYNQPGDTAKAGADFNFSIIHFFSNIIIIRLSFALGRAIL